jgi:hypothetical protein
MNQSYSDRPLRRKLPRARACGELTIWPVWRKYLTATGRLLPRRAIIRPVGLLNQVVRETLPVPYP